MLPEQPPIAFRKERGKKYGDQVVAQGDIAKAVTLLEPRDRRRLLVIPVVPGGKDDIAGAQSEWRAKSQIDRHDAKARTTAGEGCRQSMRHPAQPLHPIDQSAYRRPRA